MGTGEGLDSAFGFGLGFTFVGFSAAVTIGSEPEHKPALKLGSP